MKKVLRFLQSMKFGMLLLILIALLREDRRDARPAFVRLIIGGGF